jgi:hypothetical protein
MIARETGGIQSELSAPRTAIARRKRSIRMESFIASALSGTGVETGLLGTPEDVAARAFKIAERALLLLENWEASSNS